MTLDGLSANIVPVLVFGVGTDYALLLLARYREAGAEIFRTDRDGAVTVDSDGHSLSIYGFTGRTLVTR